MKKAIYVIVKTDIRDVNEAIRGKEIYYKCNKCQSIVPSIPKTNTHCSCNNINIDKDLNRMFVVDIANFVILKKRT
jgi:hypothetical protein